MWIPLVLVLGIAMLGTVNAPVTNTMIRVQPDKIEGHPGDVFLVTITIEDVTDLYAFGFSLKFADFGKILIVSNTMDGGFLQPNPFITKKIDLFHGIIQVGGTLIGAQPGVSGAGMLYMIEFTVVEAGESELTLFDTVLLDSNLNPMPHQTRDGYYSGPTANLVRKTVDPGRDMYVGQTMGITSSVKNNGDVPLYVRVRFDMLRDDGRLFRMYAGQNAGPGYPIAETVYLYVNEFVPIFNDWAKIGTDPYLDVPSDGSYIVGYDYGELDGYYGFEDLTLPPGVQILDVQLEGQTDGPYDENMDFDMYSWGTSSGPFAWLGSLYAAGIGLWWVTPRWIGASVGDVLPEVLGEDPTELNNLGIVFYYWTADGAAHAPAIVNSARLAVTIGAPIDPMVPPVYVVEPNKILELPPFTWELGVPALGKYYVTVTCEFSYYESLWNDAKKVSTFTWWVNP